MTYRDEADEWAAANPRRDNGGTWAGSCAAQTYQFACYGVGPYYADASTAFRTARDAGYIVSTDPAAATTAAIHYWTGGQNDYGHVCPQVDDAGTLFMATSWGGASGIPGTDGLAYVAFDTYQPHATAVGMTYQGWGWAYGANTGTRPANANRPAPIEPEDEEMLRIHHQVFTNGDQAYVVEVGSGFYIPDSNYRAALAKAYEIDLGSLPAVNEYDWNAVQDAKARDLAGFVTAITDALPGGKAVEASEVVAAMRAAWAQALAAGSVSLEP